MTPSKRPYIIGLTGGIACGKTTLANALRARGAHVIDADAISRALTGDGGKALPAIREAFGKGVFAGESLDRRALGTLVFSDAGARARLEGILHPHIAEEMRARLSALAEAGVQIAVLDVPLLHETGMDAWCDTVWCAYAPKKEQLARLARRDGLTRTQALKRLASQLPAREKARRSDMVIRTDNTPEESAKEVIRAYDTLAASIKGANESQ